MSVKVTTRLTKRLGKIKPYAEVEVFDSRRHALNFLRDEIGGIEGQPEEDWLKDIARYGYEITIEEIKK